MSTTIATSKHYDAVVVKTKRVLLRSEASVNGIRSLSRAFGISDDCGGASTTSKASFTAALQANGVELTDSDVAAVFAVLDRDGSGTVDPADFIAALRCDLTPLRRAWLSRVWLSFAPKDANGGVAIADLRAAYRADRHPAVVRRERSAAEVLEEFAATFNETTNPDGAVSPQEFAQYYSGVASACDDDEGFTALLRGVWPMPGVNDAFTMSLAEGRDTINKTFSAHQTAAEKKGISHVKNVQMEMLRVVTTEHRPKVMVSALAARQLALALRSLCPDPSCGTFLSVGDFNAALAQCRLYIANGDAVAALDTNGDGTVDVIFYLQLLLPQLPPARRSMMERLWQRVFDRKDGANRVGARNFLSKYVTKDSAERDAFLGAWDVRSVIDGKVSLEELVEWVTPISAKMQLDKDFEGMLRSRFKGFAPAE